MTGCGKFQLLREVFVAAARWHTEKMSSCGKGKCQEVKKGKRVPEHAKSSVYM